MKLIIFITAVAIVLLLSFQLQGAKAMPDTDGGFVTIADFPALVKAIKQTGNNGSFWVVLIPGTAENDGYAANLQYSIENGVLGLDWVLIAKRNIREKENFVRIIEEAGYHADLKEGNGIKYLRVVGPTDITALGQAVLKRLFGTTSSQKLQLIITDFKWQKKA
jgi:hypothetical protein